MAARLDEKINERRFADPDVPGALDEMSLAAVSAMYGAPVSHTTFAEPQGRHWTRGSGRPILADDDPAVMQAIGRCAAARSRGRLTESIDLGSIHAEPCGWEIYPLEMLLEACEWAVMVSGYLVTEMLSWKGKDDAEYARSGRGGIYTNPTWADFWELPSVDRRVRVEQAIAASREEAAA